MGAAVRRIRPAVVLGTTLISCLGLTALPHAGADPLGDIRGAVTNIGDHDSLCNPLQYSGVLEGAAQKR